MEVKSGIYCIENKTNKKKYIGSSQNVYKRRNRHFSELKNTKHKNIKLQRSYNKYGKDDFEFYVLELVPLLETLIEREQWYIDNIKPWFNINLIANSGLGVKRSDKTKDKIRQANLGLKHPEWRNKIKSDAQGGDKHWTRTKDFSDKSKNKMSSSHKALYKNGYKTPVGKAVIELDQFGNIVNRWVSQLKAGEYYKVDAMTIFNIINGKNSRKLKDKIFKYE